MNRSLRSNNSILLRWVRLRKIAMLTKMKKVKAYRKKVSRMKMIRELLLKMIRTKICSWLPSKWRMVDFPSRRTRFKWPKPYSRKATKCSRHSSNWIQQWSSKCSSISSIMCSSGSAFKNSPCFASYSYSFCELRAKCGSFFWMYCTSHVASSAYKSRNMCQSRMSLSNWWSQEQMKNLNFKCLSCSMRSECKPL